jgi:hypothetical protein
LPAHFVHLEVADSLENVVDLRDVAGSFPDTMVDSYTDEQKDGNQIPPKGQHHHWEAGFSKFEIYPKRGLDEAGHMQI